jgi:cyclic beta-1,2-glucan synthetase
LFRLLNPIYQAANTADADQYRVEPYVVAADIYSVPPYVRRGGWTWYTGSSGWLYRLGLEALLGLRKIGDRLLINPSIPKEWDSFEITYRFGESIYRVLVMNPHHVQSGVKSIRLNGHPVDEMLIPLMDNGTNHTVEVILG